MYYRFNHEQLAEARERPVWAMISNGSDQTNAANYQPFFVSAPVFIYIPIMPYALLADAVLLLHFAFVLFVVGGGLLALKWPKVAWLHLPAVFWGVWIELSASICPLTPLEQSLLSSAGEDSYAGSFIGHYLEPVLYPVGLTDEMQWWLGAIAVAINVLVYRQVLKAWKERQDKTQL